MTEIELLGEQIESMRSLLPLYFGIAFIGVIFTAISFAMEWQMRLGIIVGIVMMGTGFILLGMLNIDITPLIDERNLLIDAEINSLTCDELRVNVLNIIEGKEFEPKYLGQNIELKKDLYYYKCEVPLRDEVLKLQ